MPKKPRRGSPQDGLAGKKFVQSAKGPDRHSRAPRPKPISPEGRAAVPKMVAAMPEFITKMEEDERRGPPLAVPASNNLDVYRKKSALELMHEYKKRELRRLCLEDENGFWIYLKEVLYARPDQRIHYVEEFHGPLAYELQHLKAGENLLLCLHREARKTQLLLAYLSYLIVKDPNIRIKLVSHTIERAKKLSMMLREMFTKKSQKFPVLQEIFPDYMIEGRDEVWQATQFTLPLRTAAYLDPTVISTFMGSAGSGSRCMTPESLVVTSQGLIPIKDVKVGTQVETHTGLFQRVIAKVSREISEPIYSIRPGNHPDTLRVTGDHRILAWKKSQDGSGKVDWIPAQELTKKDFLAIPRNGMNFTRKIFSNKESQAWFESVYPKPEFWRLLGYWLAEGWIKRESKNKAGKVKHAYAFSLAFRAGEEWVSDVCFCVKEALGVPVHVHRRGPCDIVSFSHKNMALLADSFGKLAHQKRLPYWVLRTSIEHQMSLLLGYWRGDGCLIQKPWPKASATSASRDLLWGFQKILTRVGIPSSFHKLREPKKSRISGREVDVKAAWSLDVSDPRFLQMLGESRIKLFMPSSTAFLPDYWLVPIEKLEVRDYTGTVYDLQVLKDHSFCSPGLTSHNCDVLAIDDGWDNSTLTSPEQGVKITQSFIDLLPTVEGSALGRYKNIVITTTPWRLYDPTSKLMGVSVGVGDELREVSPFKIIVRHAKENPKVLCTACPKHVVDYFPHGDPDWKNGEPALKPIFTNETLEDRYRTFMIDPSLGEPSFWLQYMCVYRSVAADKFQKEWFIKLPGRSVWGDCRRRVLALDDASKDFQQLGRGDFSVAKFGEFGSEGRLLKVYAMRSNKWTRDEFISNIVAWCQATKWWPQFAVKEKVGVDNFLVDLQRTFNQYGHPVVAVPATRAGLGRKNDFIVSTLQGPYERREILFGSDYPTEMFERDVYELMNLGSVAHDDMADCDALFFTKKVRIETASELVMRSGRGEWMAPDLDLYDPKRGQFQGQQIWVPPREDTQLERIVARPGVNLALARDLGEFQPVTFAPDDGGFGGDGEGVSAGDESDFWAPDV